MCVFDGVEGGGDLSRFVICGQKDVDITLRVGVGGNECSPLPA